MKLNQLQFLKAVAEQGSINKAAEMLYTTQPNISKSIADLEKEVKFKIFNRTNKGAVLTPEGRNLYQYAQTIIAQMELISKISTDHLHPTLAVASYPILTMSRFFGDFMLNNQNELTKYHLFERRLGAVIDLVSSGKAEVGFIMNHQRQTKELKKALDFKNLEIDVVAQDTWYINAGVKSEFYDRDGVDIKEVLEKTFIRIPDDYFSNLTSYLSIAGESMLNLKNIIYTDSTAAIINIVKNTDVIRFGPGISKVDLLENNIKTIPIINNDTVIDISWIKKRNHLLSDTVTQFMNEFNIVIKNRTQ